MADDIIVCKESVVAAQQTAVVTKTLESFRQDIIDDLFRVITKEIDNSISFVSRGDYVRAKFCDYKIEGLQKAMGIILEASTIDVKEK